MPSKWLFLKQAKKTQSCIQILNIKKEQKKKHQAE